MSVPALFFLRAAVVTLLRGSAVSSLAPCQKFSDVAYHCLRSEWRGLGTGEHLCLFVEMVKFPGRSVPAIRHDSKFSLLLFS